MYLKRGMLPLQGKVKVYLDDFKVKEILDLEIKESGPYSYYILEKRNMNTLEVLNYISQRWKISRERIGFCGLKDKRAVTSQYISIKEGPEEDLEESNFKLKFIGKGESPIEVGSLKGNEFLVTIRSIEPEKITEAFEIIKKIGFANYFGEQRFTPDLHTRKPIALLLIEGKYEEALKEYLTQHPDKEKRRELRRLWKKWKVFTKEANHLTKIDRIVLSRFIKKGDAESALKVFPKSIKLLFFFSYQSLFWNRILCNLVKKYSDSFSIPFIKSERLYFYKELSPFFKEFRDLEMPFISKEVLSWDGDPQIKDEIIKLMKKENLFPILEKEVLGLKVFSPGKRRIIVFPENGEVKEYSKRKKRITIKFFLPSGCYATVFLSKLIKYPV